MKPWTWLGVAALIVLAGCGPADLPSSADQTQADSAGAAPGGTPCYFLPAETMTTVSLFSEPDGPSIAAVDRREFLAEARSGDWVLIVDSAGGRQGWVDVRQGALQGNCTTLEVLRTLPTLAANMPTAVPPTCIITVNVDTIAYLYPNFDETYATLGAGTRVEGMAQTAGGWYGFEPHIEQPGVQGVARLRWLPGMGTDTAVWSLTPHCSALPVVQYP
jgi:hypothetical protein